MKAYSLEQYGVALTSIPAGTDLSGGTASVTFDDGATWHDATLVPEVTGPPRVAPTAVFLIGPGGGIVLPTNTLIEVVVRLAGIPPEVPAIHSGYVWIGA